MKILNIANCDAYFKDFNIDGCSMVITSKKDCEPYLKDADIIVGNPTVEMLKSCENLKFLQLCSAGSDFLKKEMLPEDCQAANATGSYGTGIAEYLIGSTIMMMRNFPVYFANQKEHKWVRKPAQNTIYGSTILVVGMGDIGSEFAKRAHMMGARIIGIRRHFNDKPDYVDQMGDLSKLEEFLPVADVVVLSLPRSQDTTHIMTKKQFELMKKTAFLINVGRSNVICEEDLMDALNEDVFAGACLDVFDNEPLPENSPMWETKNLMITPHSAGNLDLPVTNMYFADLTHKNILHFLHGEPLINEIDFETGYRKYKKQ